MDPRIPRRSFLVSALASVAAAFTSRLAGAAPDRIGRRSKPRTQAAPAVSIAAGPVVAGSANLLGAPLDRAIAMLEQGADTLDAAVAAAGVLEDDPNEKGVGLGGLPNEEGVVELDASCMHGPTHEAGAIAGLRNIRNAAAVARDVLRRTDHVLLVGEGALRLARAMGYREEDLLTEASRLEWLKWKSSLSREDDWVMPDEKPGMPSGPAAARPAGTVNVNVRNARGEVSGVTSTSGLAFKLPGRVGDSPIIGAGLYVHGKVGSAGATGRGEACIIAGGAHAIVGGLQRGLHPTDACLEAARRVVEMNRMPRLLRPDGRPSFNVTFYAVTVTGQHGAASLWPGTYAAHDDRGSRLVDAAHVFDRA